MVGIHRVTRAATVDAVPVAVLVAVAIIVRIGAVVVELAKGMHPPDHVLISLLLESSQHDLLLVARRPRAHGRCGPGASAAAAPEAISR
jgi:hypothetical protein